MQKIVFGPVVSRRFGVSLGVDLSPFSKQCNFDCLYCELGKAKSVGGMQEIAPLGDILFEIKEALDKNPKIDVLTVTATGEPTLYPHFLSLSQELFAITRNRCKTLILSNGSRFGDSEISKGLGYFDIVKFSLDCVSSRCFKKLDRPFRGIEIERILEGIETFAKTYQGELVCEVLVIKNLNDSLEEMEKIASFCQKIGVHRIDLGSLDRPSAYAIQGVSVETLNRLREAFGNQCVSIPVRREIAIEKLHLDLQGLLALLKRRPLSCVEAEQILDSKSLMILENLLVKQEVLIKSVASLDFYTLKS